VTGRSFAVTAAFVAACSFTGAKTGHDHADAPRDDGGGGDADAAPSATCGNGVVEAGEECDDGNTAGSDGCGATCEIEPAWLCPSGSGCELVTGLAFTTREQLAFVGVSTGGGFFSHMCGPGKGIVGFQATPSDDNAHLSQVAAICAQINFDRATGSATGSNEAPTAAQGNENHPPITSTTCAGDELVVGFQGDADQFLAGIGLLCAPISVEHGVFQVGSAHELAMYGPANAQLDPAEPCAAGEVAQVYDGSSGATVDHFGMACASVAPAF
jgi:cysteine-rich repeat protein